MCGRYSLTETTSLDTRFLARIVEEGWLRPRYNIAPTQTIPVVTNEGERVIEPMRWGLIPVWAKDPNQIRNTINARDDRLTSSGLWKRPLRSSRCLIPASGFFEWTGPKGARRPMHIRLKDGSVFAFAGLYDEWTDQDGKPVRSCAIVTTKPNELMEPIHNRMPVILHQEAESLWLDPMTENPDQLMPIIRPYPAEEMEAHQVSSAVNSPRNESAECLVPVE